MRQALVIVSAFAALLLSGCKSKEQKSQDLTASYQAANAAYQKDCSASTSDQDGKAIVGSAFGNKPSPQQQAVIDQHQRDAEARKSSPHCKELEAQRDDVTKKMLVQ